MAIFILISAEGTTSDDTVHPNLIKVAVVMQRYGCFDQGIRDSIMNTFDPVLVACVIGAESSYRTKVVSHTGCRGLMQLSPDKLDEWDNPAANIRIGSAYLQYLMNRFCDERLTLAAYNAGPTNVHRFQGVPPFRETWKYIAKIQALREEVNNLL